VRSTPAATGDDRTRCEETLGVTALPDLPFVDEYSRDVAAAPVRTWDALQRYVETLTSESHSVLFGVLGTVPRSGFEVVDSDPPREVVLAGRHRFSTYQLVFRVDAVGTGSRLRALTYAEFPGLRGRVYRTGLMLSTGHRRATEGMLRKVARRAEA
jgi:hypothetical protein